MSNDRPGSSTSEFKLTAGGIVGSFAAAVAAVLAGHPKIALALAALAAVLATGYTFLRTWLKKERAGAVDWLSAQQEAALERALRAVGTLSDVLKLVVGEQDETSDEPDQPDKPDAAEGAGNDGA
jgi:hypothetical protein